MEGRDAVVYRITCDGYPLLDMRDESLIVTDPQCTVEVNTIGSASFDIYKVHPFYDKMQILKSCFEISDDFGVIFRGRMTADSMDFYMGKSVELEGAMGYFNDSVVRPFTFPDDFLEDADYMAAAESGNVVEFLLKRLIESHNAQVQDFQKFKVGNVTVSDPNNYIERADSGYVSTWEALKSKLFESSLGGFLCIRYEPDGNYIDYLSEFTLVNTQTIEFGKNLLDRLRETDAKATYSAMIPIGAEIEETAEDGTVSKHKLTLEALVDGDSTDDVVKSGDTIYSKSAVEKYGWIYAPIAETTWEDVTEAENLLTKSTELLVNAATSLATSEELTAADLHLTDKEIQSFRIYRKIKAKQEAGGVFTTFDLTKLHIALLDPQSTKITVGKATQTLTEATRKYQSEAIERVQAAEKNIEETKEEVTEVKNQAVIERTEILNTCSEIILNALESYVEKSNFEEFRETAEAELKLLAEQLEISFTRTIEQIELVNGDLQAKYNTITKYFTFGIDGLTIGQSDSPNKVVIDNDEISILVNGLTVQKFDAEGRALIPELTVTKNLDLFGFQIDQDSEGRVNCDYVGGDA